ncbi:MAG: SLC13/DASS family transporter [Planctomycetales bacterium]|nr:SLC13/DASS family transporter [bacterium]UNM07428.1 MAG: SLC13/DASS family transporter [Planctomycetales bacterium]
MANLDSTGRRGHWLAIAAGPLLALLLVLFADLQPGQPAVTRMAAVALWMAIWWISEAVPLAVTALLPVAVFPLLSIMSGKQVATQYFNNVIFLFIGGFIIALAMQRWNLHRRIALGIIGLVGQSPARLLLGFMLATAFLSMWISNTATTMMMVPIAMAVILRIDEGRQVASGRSFPTGLLLGIAYAASIGGISTLVGTPPNLSFLRIHAISFPDAPEISFTQWLLFAAPMCIVLLAAVWLFLFRLYGQRQQAIDAGVFEAERRQLGQVSREEWGVLSVFVGTALLWLTRSDITVGTLQLRGWASPLGLDGMVDDGTVAILMALLLFIIPSKRSDNGRLMGWEDTLQLPWGIVLLFGGGFALASGFKESGLSEWCGGQLSALSGVHPVVMVLAICLLITFLTELTSNTATTEMILPVLAATAVAINVDPLLLMVPATISASCAFMLPVATPPNAIIFGSGRISMAEMARAGLLINLFAALLVTASVFLLGSLLGIGT